MNCTVNIDGDVWVKCPTERVTRMDFRNWIWGYPLGVDVIFLAHQLLLRGSLLLVPLCYLSASFPLQSASDIEFSSRAKKLFEPFLFPPVFIIARPRRGNIRGADSSSDEALITNESSKVAMWGDKARDSYITWTNQNVFAGHILISQHASCLPTRKAW